MSRTFYVTTPIYYVNDAPHLGTAYTTVAADVMARYRRLRGDEAMFLTGLDEHGLKIERVAKDAGLEPQAYADSMVGPFKDAWTRLGCGFDHFIRTTDPAHVSGAQDFWKLLEASGDLYLGTYEGWYCVGCEAYCTEKDLGPENTCKTHGRPVERVREPSYFFRLSKYADRLLALYEDRPGFVSPDVRLNEVKALVREGLEDISVSRTSFKWGVPVPGDPDHVMYVWLDALANYWTAARADGRGVFWPPDVQLVGKDILRFHAVYWPAFLMSAGYGGELPRRLFAHGFLTFNGHKMSKSLRNTVSPAALADAFGADAVRYCLMRSIAFGQDGDFSVRDLVQRYNSELGNSLGNLLNRVLRFCPKHFRSGVPGTFAPALPETLDLLASFSRLTPVVAEQYESIQPHLALGTIWSLLQEVNTFVDRTKPWEAAKADNLPRLGNIVRAALDALERVSVMIWPVMPEKSGEIRKQIGVPSVETVIGTDIWASGSSVIKTGNPIGGIAHLFPRIDEAREKEIVLALGDWAAQ